jgi:hypothetical protein
MAKTHPTRKSKPAANHGPERPGKSARETGRSVRIRMYRQGLGDCFLITFRKPDGTKTNVVIDCGVLTGSPKGSDRIKLAVENIKEETGGAIDLLVATHEHADHLSGFNQARETWEQIHIKMTWMAWTEDLTSPAVKAQKDRQATRLTAVLGGMDKLSSLWKGSNVLGLTDSALKLEGGASSLRGLLDFALDEDDDPADLLNPKLAGSELSGPARALKYLKERAGKDLEYCHPKQAPRPLPGRDDVTVYVLGPPDGPLLRYQDPDRPGEGYLVRSGPTDDASFGLAVADAALFGQKDATAAAPFDPFYQLKIEDVKAAPDGIGLMGEAHTFFEEHYGFQDLDTEAYRRIDHDWLNLAEAMALSHISYVNNTSLALAFELVEGGPVLLFPGDAQIGSWLSWKDLSWEVGSGPDKRTIKGPDLLKEVVFYKVGHHGSHNATLKSGGLEAMTSPDLVAFIPVHQKTARKHNPPWIMPWDNLREALNKSNVAGRVILSDQDENEKSQTERPGAAGANPSRWTAFTKALEWDRSADLLWVDYTYHY